MIDWCYIFTICTILNCIPIFSKFHLTLLGQMVRNNSAESSGNPVGPLGYPGMTKPHHFRAKKLHNVFTLNMTFSTGSVVKRSTIRFVDLAPSDQVFGGTTTGTTKASRV